MRGVSERQSRIRKPGASHAKAKGGTAPFALETVRFLYPCTQCQQPPTHKNAAAEAVQERGGCETGSLIENHTQVDRRTDGEQKRAGERKREREGARGRERARDKRDWDTSDAQGGQDNHQGEQRANEEEGGDAAEPACCGKMKLMSMCVAK